MKISMINGSQKKGESNSGIILGWLNNLLKDNHTVTMYNCGTTALSPDTLKEIITADALVLAFPLFVYTMPSQTLAFLIELETTIKRERADHLIIYTIINNGFYEGKQNNVAFENIKHWCAHAGVRFGGGIGQGAGEMIAQTKDVPLHAGPFKNLNNALQALVQSIRVKRPFDIVYLNPSVPQFLWKFMAVRFWNGKARKNGLTKKDVKKRL